VKPAAASGKDGTVGNGRQRHDGQWQNRKIFIIVSRGSLEGVDPGLISKMDKLDIPAVPEFIEMIAGTGAGLCACTASVALFGLAQDDFIEQVKDIITVSEFYDLAAGGQIIFT
jgi:predicted peroxiredoxin